MSHEPSAAPKWVSVSEGMPEVDKPVMLWNGYSLYFGAWDGEGFYSWEEYIPVRKVTHWMEIEPPTAAQ